MKWKISRAFVGAVLAAAASVMTADNPKDPQVIGTAIAIVLAATSGGARRKGDK